MNRHTIASSLAGIGILVGVLIGCHAKDDDAAGQAEELSDAVRRENAITNLERLYSSALAAANGDRSVQTLQDEHGRDKLGPRGIADASADALSSTYVDFESGSANGMRMLSLLADMQDARGLPAFTKALDWRQAVSEDHAVAAAQAIQRLELTAAQKGPVIEAIARALERVQGRRGSDNRMRIAFIRALGATGDDRASPPLMRIAVRIHEAQDFEINRQAGIQAGHLRAESAVPDLIKTLFLFGANRPDRRMNDVGGQALTQVGRPALQPLLALLAGDNEDANRLSASYITAVGRASEELAGRLNERTIVVGEACFALGQLGLSEAFDPLMAHVTPLTRMTVAAANASGEESREVYSRALGCVSSLVQVRRTEAQDRTLRRALQDVYARIPEDWPPEAPYTSRGQVLAAMAHTYDPELLTFLHGIAEDREYLPDFRVLAFRSYAMMASGDEVPRIRAVLEAEAEGSEIRNAFNELLSALATADACGNRINCYIELLGSEEGAPHCRDIEVEGEDEEPDEAATAAARSSCNDLAVSKAANMIARFGAGNNAALPALVAQLSHDDVAVRGDVLYAIDHVAANGSPEAVARIDEIRDEEAGRASWVQIQSVAMAIQGRLQARGGSE